MEIKVHKESETPIYRQIVDEVVKYASSPDNAGRMLPSMNVLAQKMDISRETVKKAYAILVERGFIEPKQGLGFFIASRDTAQAKTILVLFDKLSAYKQILLSSMAETLGPSYQLTIRLHNQQTDLLRFYLDEAIDRYDYYIVSPHFPLDSETQEEVCRLLRRIPNRKMIMVDRYIDLDGNFGAVYQDFDNDISEGLEQGLQDLRKYNRLNVITLPSSLYHECISASVQRFCRKNRLSVHFSDRVEKDQVRAGDVFLLLNSQLDSGLLDLTRAARSKGLEIGRDVGIISYNEEPINELVLGGLTTVSTDFRLMGRHVGEMIVGKCLRKIRCEFDLIRRNTF